VTIPAVAPEVPPEFVLTGKELGKEESQVTELVRSLTYGAVENVPIARKFPVSSKLPTVSEPGIIVSETRGSAAGVFVTVTDAGVASTTELGMVAVLTYSAVMLVEPGLLPVTTPSLSGVHTGGVAVLQVLV
jgi:hypothetical protein